MKFVFSFAIILFVFLGGVSGARAALPVATVPLDQSQFSSGKNGIGMGECKPLLLFGPVTPDANDDLLSITVTVQGSLKKSDLNTNPDLFGGHAFILIKDGDNSNSTTCLRSVAAEQGIVGDSVVAAIDVADIVQEDFSSGVNLQLTLDTPSPLAQQPILNRYFFALITSESVADISAGSRTFSLSTESGHVQIDTNEPENGDNGVVSVGDAYTTAGDPDVVAQGYSSYSYFFAPPPEIETIVSGSTVLLDVGSNPAGTVISESESSVDVVFSGLVDSSWINNANSVAALRANTGNVFDGAPGGANLLANTANIKDGDSGGATCAVTFSSAQAGNGLGASTCMSGSVYARFPFLGDISPGWYTFTIGSPGLIKSAVGSIFQPVSYRIHVIDDTAPFLSGGNPADADATLEVNAADDEDAGNLIYLQFNELLDHASVSDSLLRVYQDGESNNWCDQLDVVDLDSETFIICRHKDFLPETTYSIVVTGGVADLAGNESIDYTGLINVSFETSQSGGTHPSFTGSTPATSASSGPRLAINPDFTIDFSEQIVYTPGDIVMYANTGNAENGAATGSAIAVTCTSSIVAHATRLTCSPNTALSYATWYRLNITTGINDLTGNALGATQSIQYYTVNDTTAPTVSAATPTSGATSQEINALAFSIVFSEDLDSDTITGQVSYCPTATSGGVCASDAVAVSPVSLTGGDTLQFSLSGLLYSTWYKVTVGTGVEDLAGNALASIYTLPFQTRSAPVSGGGGGGAVIYFLPQVTTTSQAVQGGGGQVEPKLEFASAGDGVVRVKVLNRGNAMSITYSTDPSFGVSTTAVIDVDNNALLRVDAGTTVVYAYIPSGIMYTYNISNTTSAVGKPVAEGEANSASARYVFTRNMRYGMTGDDVRELQKILNQLGYNVTQKGKEIRTYGLRTVNAVRAFQRANKLSPVGNVGPATRELLNKVSEK